MQIAHFCSGALNFVFLQMHWILFILEKSILLNVYIQFFRCFQNFFLFFLIFILFWSFAFLKSYFLVWLVFSNIRICLSLEMCIKIWRWCSPWKLCRYLWTYAAVVCRIHFTVHFTFFEPGSYNLGIRDEGGFEFSMWNLSFYLLCVTVFELLEIYVKRV